MTELTRLLASSSSSNVRTLLQAGLSDAAPPDFAERLRSALAVGVTTAGVASGAKIGTAATLQATTAAKLSSSGATLLIGKWLALGVLGGAALAGGSQWALSPRASAEKPAAPAPIRATPTAVSSFTAAASAAEAPAEVPSATAAVVATNRAVSMAARTPTLEEARGLELQAIDRARRALASGDLSSAFAELDEYERVARTHVLEREARVLRIEVLYRAGNAPAARNLSDSYLRDYPNDAHAGRLRALRESAENR